MDGDIERILEFDKIKGIIAGYCASGLGKSLAQKLKPLTDITRIQRMLNICSEVKDIKLAGDKLSLGGLRDIRRLMKKAEVSGAILEPQELLDILSTIQVARRLINFAEESTEEYPIMSEIISGLSEFPDLEKSIPACVDLDGNIMDSASPQLARIRRQLVTAREKVISLLESILRSPHYQTAIQENLVTIRNNRYVIPVKQNFRSSLPGVIQSSSASGATVFIEPAGVVELNNKSRDLEDQERIEIRKILKELTDNVREALPDLEPTVQILAEIDLMNAKVQICIRLGTTKPKLNRDGYIELTQARHPILQITSDEDDDNDGRKVVPINFSIGDGFDTLVITGPNTGGKTVALKTIGILTLMMQIGLHIPADEGSQMSVFQDVFADIGDEQSIEQNLSTFSSHMTRIIRIVEAADNTSLVLLDELGAGTEPSEGAALGMAILDFLHSRGVKTIATTHHDSLKAHAHSQEGMENASVAFDLKTLKPTYELRIGVPGSSNALRIADRLGLPKEIGEKARDYLGSEALEVADLISTVEGMHRDLEEQKELAEEKVLSASRTQREHELLLQQLKSRKRKLEREALLEASNIVQNARKLAESTISELRKEKASPKSVQNVRQTLIKAKKEIASAVESPPQVESREAVSGELKAGDEIYVSSLRRRGILMSLPDAKNMVRLRIGNAKLNVPMSDVRVALNAEPSRAKVVAANDNKGTEPPVPARNISIRQSRKSGILPTLDLRGDRAEEALDRTDKYLDDAALAGLESVYIVHGKGTGVLRTVVTELLMDHPHVAGFRLGNRNEGGEGVTVVELKG